ncbi:ferritin-like domain-containing protein [Noviherbaspirillum suwonense]|uniref:Ferritin-like n=1 Tax=Noviherbaspirillum suwonense TaxID=1224511 RepID=A0ABY1Q1Q9_9BURK|nr:ferritin-like domain-containing protein [Noviherbaspirillum suwonense]SMP54391.1 Ferritin-like [Noviherbaspirillum suwonense]
MRARTRRQIHLLIDQDIGQLVLKHGLNKESSLDDRSQRFPSEFGAHQYVVMLLHVAAEIEHMLMVQYLYAAYSLGGDQVPERYRRKVASWQSTILGIAKEEMAHLMTVQNVLRCIGGPLNFDREDYPSYSELYPFPFLLEPLTRTSLAKYVYAEAPDPDSWSGQEADEIREIIQDGDGTPYLNRVGKVYKEIIDIIQDEHALEDKYFRDTTHSFQSNWDEWGRGYANGERRNPEAQDPEGSPSLILRPVSSRSDAVSALNAIAVQGEANSVNASEAKSHFARFLNIYRDFPDRKDWIPTRNVVINPSVSPVDLRNSDTNQLPTSTITHPISKLWGNLFNIRYRILLSSLAHSYDYRNDTSMSSSVSPRGLLIHTTFGEMYNIRSISGILIQSPVSTDNDQEMAGPPFQMPYTLTLPHDPVDRWALYLDLFSASIDISFRLKKVVDARHRSFLDVLISTDQKALTKIEALINSLITVSRTTDLT